MKLVAHETRQLVLKLEAAEQARLRDLAVALVQWGFTEGLRYGGGGRSGGAP